MRPDIITQIIRKQLFCVTDVCVIGKSIPRQIMRVILRSQKVPYEGP